MISFLVANLYIISFLVVMCLMASAYLLLSQYIYPTASETLKRFGIYLSSRNLMNHLSEYGNFLSDDMQRFIDLLNIEIYCIEIDKRDLDFIYNLFDKIHIEIENKENGFGGVNSSAVYNDDNFVCQISWLDLNLTKFEWESLERVRNILEERIK